MPLSGLSGHRRLQHSGGVCQPVGVADLQWVACAEGDSPCVPALTPGRHAHFATPSATLCRPPTPWYDTPPTQSGPLRRVVSFAPQVRNGVRLNQGNHSGAVCAGSNPAGGTSPPPRRTSGIGTPLLFSFRRCLSPRWSCASRPVRRDPHPASQACQSRATSSGAPGRPRSATVNSSEADMRRNCAGHAPYGPASLLKR
ncbi:MAG: hypothetical protein QOC85_3981 [Streptomyces sp.]|nr:hypothetical protein [Streptomyces sp.]